ncbi:MAG: DUF1801 domain-containing protein [Pseudomonadota bacterium]
MTHSTDRFDELKALIIKAAHERPEIGALGQSMKWGQPSFTPAKAGVGSSVRIETRADGEHALMFICTTGLVDTFRDIYGDTLAFDGKRAIRIPADGMSDAEALKHCVQLALTHKLRKRKRR